MYVNNYILFCVLASLWICFLHRFVMPVGLVIDFMMYTLFGQDFFELKEDELKMTGLYKALIPTKNKEDTSSEEYHTPREDPPCLFT